MKTSISSLDSVIILVYLVLILLVGIIAAGRKKMNSHRYFLAGRGLNWVLVGSALFASNISTIHLVGLAASGYSEGLVWGNLDMIQV